MSLALGSPAPPFALPTATGDTAAVRAGGDAPTVVAFWCNHCPYVRAWEERFDSLASEYGGRGVGFVAVNANDATAYPADSFAAMAERAAERGFAFDYAHDESQEVARTYGAERTPEVFVFGADGALAYHGAIDDSTEPDAVSKTYLRDALEALLAGEPVPTAETPPVGCTIKWRR